MNRFASLARMKSTGEAPVSADALKVCFASKPPPMSSKPAASRHNCPLTVALKCRAACIKPSTFGVISSSAPSISTCSRQLEDVLRLPAGPLLQRHKKTPVLHPSGLCPIPPLLCRLSWENGQNAKVRVCPAFSLTGAIRRRQDALRMRDSIKCEISSWAGRIRTQVPKRRCC